MLIVRADVVRVNISKLRVCQLLIPLATIASVVARRTQSLSMTIGALAAIGAGIVVLFVARRSFGKCSLQFGSGRIRLGDGHGEILASDIRTWTLDRSVARLDGSTFCWKLSAKIEEGDLLRTQLTAILGRPKLLKRRGSPRVRGIALGVAVLGAAILAVGISMDVVAAAFIGTPCLVLGLAVFGAFSQKVAV